MGWRGGVWGADTTGGGAMGYRIMKYTLHSPGASPHLSWGSQMSQVTQPPPPKQNDPPLQVSAAQRGPAATCTPVVSRCWSDSTLKLNLLFVVILRTGIKYTSKFHTGGGGEKNIQEMKSVTRSSVCQASPQAGTKRPEKSCWVYFSLHVMWKPLKGWGKGL